MADTETRLSSASGHQPQLRRIADCGLDALYISLSPSIARWKQADVTRELNEKVAAFIKGEPHLRYIETYDIVYGADGKARPDLFRKDMLHFNADGYKLLTERVGADANRFYPSK